MTAVPYPPVTGREPCTRVDPDRFFPESGNNRGAQEAAAMCTDCPVLLPCLAWAVANERYGVWAGTTADQRAQLRRMGKASERRAAA